MLFILKKEKMKGYIYKHTAPNGKVYIGQTIQSIYNRFLNGKGYCRCKLFYKAIQKYGWNNIQHEILFEIEGSKETVITELNKKEKEFIELYKANDNNYGYNLRSGGDNSTHSELSKVKMRQCMLGKHLSEETKHKISISHLGEKNANFGRTKEKHPMFNKHHTEEAKKKISEGLRGSKNYQSINYKLFDKNNNLVAIGNSYELNLQGYCGCYRHCSSKNHSIKYVKDKYGNKYTVERG